jgi:hypothetical protein
MTLDSFYGAPLAGVMEQSVLDPERAPWSRGLAEALRTIAADRRFPAR